MTDLRGRWYHSFEEDHDGIQVYRPETYDFPLARGRGSVEFGPDGRFVDWNPGPADAPEATPGSWAADETLERLEVTVGNRNRVVDVVSHQPDKLELRIGDSP